MAKALPEWERFEAEQRALSESSTSSSQPEEWTRMDDESGSSTAPVLLMADHQSQRLSRNMQARPKAARHPAQARAFNQQLVDFWCIAAGRGPFYWSDGFGAVAQTITYGFPTSGSFATGYSEANGWSAFTSSQQDAARLALSMWDDLIAPSIVESANGNTADIKLSNTTNSGLPTPIRPASLAMKAARRHVSRARYGSIRNMTIPGSPTTCDAADRRRGLRNLPARAGSCAGAGAFRQL
jgi:hypothetical protein